MTVNNGGSKPKSRMTNAAAKTGSFNVLARLQGDVEREEHEQLDPKTPKPQLNEINI